MSDTNWQSYYGDNPDTSGFVNPPNPQDFDDIMKFSDCRNVTVTSKDVAAGRENCVDAVRGSYYEWIACTFASGSGIATFTIKGAINGWLINDCLIGRGKKCEIEVGQYDDYWKPGRSPTRNGMVSLNRTTDGKPIRITLWDADAPKVVGNDVKIRKIPWIVWFPYFMLRYLTK